MHECLENRGELTDQEIVHSVRPAELTANEERKSILQLSVSSLRRLVLCFLKAPITAYHYLSKENIYANLHIPLLTTKIDLKCHVSCNSASNDLKIKMALSGKKKIIYQEYINLFFFNILRLCMLLMLTPHKTKEQVSQFK